MKVKNRIIILLAVIALALSGQSVYADTLTGDFALQYQSCDASNVCTGWIEVGDNQSGDLNVRLGVILLSANPGIWNVVVESGKAGRDPADPNYPLANLNMSLSSNVTTSGGSGSLKVQLSQRNLSPAAPGWQLDWSPTFSGSGLSMEIGAWASQTNNLFDKEQFIKSFGPTGTSTAYSGSGLVDPNLQSPYSLTMEVVFTAQNATNGSGTTGGGVLTPLQGIQSVPEPGSLILLGAGLISLATFRRRSALKRNDRK